jgi:integrase
VDILELPSGLEDLRLHDLRHAFASVAAGSGMGPPIIGKIFRHTQAFATHRCAHLAADPVKAAAAAAAQTIADAMTGRPSAEVVKLFRRTN